MTLVFLKGEEMNQSNHPVDGFVSNPCASTCEMG